MEHVIAQVHARVAHCTVLQVLYATGDNGFGVNIGLLSVNSSIAK